MVEKKLYRAIQQQLEMTREKKDRGHQGESILVDCDILFLNEKIIEMSRFAIVCKHRFMCCDIQGS